jgi:4'-phosphopantetheinyl transferase
VTFLQGEPGNNAQRAVAHLCVASIPEVLASRVAQVGCALGACDVQRLATIEHPHRRRQFLAGRVLARSMLCEVFGSDPGAWPIVADTGCKPVIQAREDVHLSISHCGEWVACAVAGVPLGVDIERCRTLRHTQNLVCLVCNRDERNTLAALRPDERELYFVGLWTLKEAWLKCHGDVLDTARMRAMNWMQAGMADACAASWLFAQAGIAVSLAAPCALEIMTVWPDGLAPHQVQWRNPAPRQHRQTAARPPWRSGHDTRTSCA